ncbi:MAG: peroxiredoxin [Candidatus Marinimicrobia bacterium]|jgi:peroxiredoxin (alkyl hydroperoxide reductase subunit C)|nr:peroxiredoxin [Candidatus Neomarinimicrobiota bacterium]MBT4155800.1 peroxiredoxin [Candidatus Neomarinimicrobiota bacterium]MBT5116177.1 peroxiredoxin [Candidatus Neomarinimicrobiota bacterium]MBT5749242.1 peroxiredoxin [Candidatus Neomarinimicrobiota bacterium]MBT6414409.1 peroxiredoxin [Candidatus Neomarinimicrobiota bacterium]|tara:strand:+ start:521 stop:1165 length:645 start_codon:yes stop_codon:yes gene_type:complete
MLVTQTAPDFKATAIMPDNSFKDISISDYKGKKVVLFFYPLDFTFVCPTELIAFDKRLAEFEKRNTQIIGCSVDSKWAHFAWKNTEVKNGGIGNVQYPIIADIDKSIARDYDVLIGAEPATVLTEEEEYETTIGGAVALRGSFLIDEDGTVRHAVINDLPLGRNIDEMLRMIDALSHNQKHGEVCPAGWVEGKDAMGENPDGISSYLTNHSEQL